MFIKKHVFLHPLEATFDMFCQTNAIEKGTTSLIADDLIKNKNIIIALIYRRVKKRVTTMHAGTH